MRESIGGAWLMGLVITFILFFVAFLSITSNYTKAFRIKNEMLDFIEREEGMTTSRSNNLGMGAMPLINNYLFLSGYGGQGKCDEGWYGVTSLSTEILAYEERQPGKNYYYCFRKEAGFDENNPNRSFYEVNVFFRLDIPVIGSLLNLKVAGTSNTVSFPADCETPWGANSCGVAGGSGTPLPPVVHTVKFVNTDDSLITSASVIHGYPVNRPSDPFKSGYDFDDWYSDIALTNEYNFGSAVTENNLKIYAKWKVETDSNIFTVSFNSNGGNVNPANQNIQLGGKVQVVAVPTKAGYDFDGWRKTTSTGVRWNFDTDTVASNMTLVAAWKANETEFKLLSVTPAGGLIKPLSKWKSDAGETVTMIVIESTPGSPTIKLNFSQPVASLSYKATLDTCLDYIGNPQSPYGTLSATDINGSNVTINLTNKNGQKPVGVCYTNAWFEKYDIDVVSTSGVRLKMKLDELFIVILKSKLDVCFGEIQYEIPGQVCE